MMTSPFSAEEITLTFRTVTVFRDSKKLLRKPNESFFKVHHEEVILLRQVTKVINSIHIATFKNAEEEVQQHSLIHS